MTERTCYEFNGFRLDPVRRSLLNKGKPTPLRPTAFDLLVVLVENHGHTLTKSEITKRVWGSDSHDDGNFHVTLHAVRQKLGDSAHTPRFIARDANGYRFVADVERVATGSDPTPGVQSSTSNIKDQTLDAGQMLLDNTSGRDFRVSREDSDSSAGGQLLQRGTAVPLRSPRVTADFSEVSQEVRTPSEEAGLQDVRTLGEQAGEQDVSAPGRHLTHVFVSCSFTPGSTRSR